jgi:outer membrane receptor protein involved in Fe transport
LEVTGKDEFFFSNSHDKVSKSYNLVNLKIGDQQQDWSVALWGRNILDKKYAVRGFFFANEPPNFIDTLYTRQGDPKNWGVTFRLKF